MIKILYALNGVFASGGTEAVILSYYNNIDRSRFAIDFLVHGFEESCRENKTHQYLEERGSKIFYVVPRGKDPLKNAIEIRKILTENKYDIVHSHMDSAGAFLLDIAKKCGVKVRISHSHNTADQLPANLLKRMMYSQIYRTARRKLNKVATVKLACSTEAGKWLYGDTDFIVINNATDLDKFTFNRTIREIMRAELGVENCFVVGHVGRFAEQKNHIFLIDVFNEIAKKDESARLLLIGPDANENKLTGISQIVRDKVESLKLSDKVLFLGVRSDVEKLMQAMDAFALPSLFEGMPVVLVEAQASNLPCFVSDRITRDADASGQCVYLPINNPVLWAEHLLEAKNHGDRETRITKKLAEEFSYDAVIKKLSEVYEKACKE